MEQHNNSHLLPAYGERLTDSSRVITPKENHWQQGNEKADFDAAVGRVTNWNADNFQGAYDAAAKKGTGVVFIVGSQNTRDTQDTLKNMEALKAKNPGAEIVFLDKDKIATDPRYQGLRDWVQKNTNNSDCSFMAQYGVRPGKDGKPEGGNLVSTHWGSDTSGVAQQMQFGKMQTEHYKGQFKIPEAQPEKKPDGTANPTPETKTRPLDVDKQYRELQEQRKKAKDIKSSEQARAYYRMPASADGKNPGGAITQADSIDQKAVSTELTQVNAAIADAQKAGQAGAQKLAQLQERQQKLQSLHDAPAETRKEFAQKLFADGAAESAKPGDADKLKGANLTAEGYRLINEANQKVPGYFNSDSAKQELRAMGFSDKAIENLNKPAVPGSTKPLSENLYGMTEDERKELYKPGNEKALQDKQREILEAAIADAKAKNLPLVIKYGMQGCLPCMALDKSAMGDLGKSLQGKAVVAAVDGPAAAQVLREHGFNLDHTGFPAVDGFNVDKAGNLTRGTNAVLTGGQLTSYDGRSISDTPARSSIPQMVEGMRAERAAQERLNNESAAARRAREKQAEDDAKMNEWLNREKRNLYQFAGRRVVV